MFLWFDPGKSGWYTILNEEKEIVECWVIPVIWKDYDKQWMKEIFNKHEYHTICIEQPGVIFGIWKSSMMSLGHWLGLLEWMAAMTKSRVIMVKPKVWQELMFKNVTKQYKTKSVTKKDWTITTKRTHDTKATAESAVLSFYPNQDFRKSPRCSNRHDGIIDATLVAYYGTTI